MAFTSLYPARALYAVCTAQWKSSSFAFAPSSRLPRRRADAMCVFFSLYSYILTLESRTRLIRALERPSTVSPSLRARTFSPRSWWCLPLALEYIRIYSCPGECSARFQAVHVHVGRKVYITGIIIVGFAAMFVYKFTCTLVRICGIGLTVTGINKVLFQDIYRNFTI